MKNMIKLLKTIFLCCFLLSILDTSSLNFSYQNSTLEIQENDSFGPIAELLSLN